MTSDDIERIVKAAHGKCGTCRQLGYDCSHLHSERLRVHEMLADNPTNIQQALSAITNGDAVTLKRLYDTDPEIHALIYYGSIGVWHKKPQQPEMIIINGPEGLAQL